MSIVIAATSLVEAGSGGNGYTTSSVTPTVGRAPYLFVIVGSSGMSDHLVSIAGNNLTWTKNYSNESPMLFWGTGVPVAGVITFTFDGGSYTFDYALCECQDAATAVTAPLQHGSDTSHFNTYINVTLGSPLTSQSALFGYTYSSDTNDHPTPRAGASEITYTHTNLALETAYTTDGLNTWSWVAGSYDGSSDVGKGVVVEVSPNNPPWTLGGRIPVVLNQAPKRAATR